MLVIFMTKGGQVNFVIHFPLTEGVFRWIGGYAVKPYGETVDGVNG